MSRVYEPDRWEIIKFKDKDKTRYKVLGGWNGGYLDSDKWRLSSGLNSVEGREDYYLMYNYSGSVYKCHKKCRGMTGLSSHTYDLFKRNGNEEGVEVSTISVEDYIKENNK